MGDDPYTMKDLREATSFEEVQEVLGELSEQLSMKSKNRAPSLSTDETGEDSETDESDEGDESDEDNESSFMDITPPHSFDEYQIEPPETSLNLEWGTREDHRIPSSVGHSDMDPRFELNHEKINELAKKKLEVSSNIKPGNVTEGTEVTIGGNEHTVKYDGDGNVQFIKKDTDHDDLDPEPDREYGCSGCGTNAFGHGVKDEYGDEFCSVSCLNETITDE